MKIVLSTLSFYCSFIILTLAPVISLVPPEVLFNVNILVPAPVLITACELNDCVVAGKLPKPLALA